MTAVRPELTVAHAGEDPPRSWHGSVFLAGPTPRRDDVAPWRPAALRLLAEHWTGPGRLVVFVPEPRDGRRYPAYDDQVVWEDRWLSVADVLTFWVPRDMATLPGLTTNVEFGRYESSGRLVLGAPEDAEHMRYLRHHARRHGAPVVDTLDATVAATLAMIGGGAPRRAGECDVPLPIWRDPRFVGWLAGIRQVGDDLLGARALWALPGDDGRLRAWVLEASRYTGADGTVRTEAVTAAPLPGDL